MTYLGLVHDALWNSALFLSTEGVLEQVGLTKDLTVKRQVFGPPPNWEDGLRLLGGFIQGGRSSSALSFFTLFLERPQGGTLHLSSTLPPLEVPPVPLLERHIQIPPLRPHSGTALQLGTSYRPRRNVMGHEHPHNHLYFVDSWAWTYIQPSGILLGASYDPLDAELLVSPFKENGSRGGQVQDFKLPLSMGNPEDWRLQDIHPTIGHQVVFFNKKKVTWSLLKIPPRGKILEVQWEKLEPSRPYSWTRLGYRLFSLPPGDVIFEFWNGVTVRPSMV